MRREGIKNGERIRQIKTLLAEGKSRNQIASLLGITRQAVSFHLKSAQKKENNRQEASPKKGRKHYVRDWRVYNEALVKRGEFLLDTSMLKEEKARLDEMNRGKKRWWLSFQRCPDRDVHNNTYKIQVRLSDNGGIL